VIGDEDLEARECTLPAVVRERHEAQVIDRLLDAIVLADRALHFVVETGVDREARIDDRVLGAHRGEQLGRHRSELISCSSVIAALLRTVNVMECLFELYVLSRE
jgi:hypothetical protein